MEFIKNGNLIIQAEIDKAKAEGVNKAVISGNYEIEKEIRIPSNFRLILENCHLRQGDNTYCNIFVNEHLKTEEGKTCEGRDKNIVIEGRGEAILDGGEYNGLCERNSLKGGNPHIFNNCLLLFSNVENFEIKNLKMINQRYWAMNFIFCSNGKIHDIDFCSNPAVLDEDGNITYGLNQNPNKANHLVKNADGIDLRVGCHDIAIENISGFCEDDVIAFTGLLSSGYVKDNFYVEGEEYDMYNLSVRNVNACSLCSIVRLLNQGGTKLYNVLIDGVFDSSKSCKYLERGKIGIRIGDTRMYGSRHSTADECFNITVKNVFVRALDVMRIAGDMRDVYLENIRGFDGNENYIVNNSNIDIDKIIKN